MFELGRTYTTKEFLEQIGISPNTWKKKEVREKYIAYLKNYISYEVQVSGRSNLYTITAIYADYIKPNFKKRSDTIEQQVRKEFDNIWKKGQPETCTRVAAIMIKNKLIESDSEKGVSDLISQVRDEKYGKPGSTGGPEGRYYYVRAKMYRNQRHPIGYDKDNKPIWDKSKYTYELLSDENKRDLYCIHMKWYPTDIEKIDTLREGLQTKQIKSLEEVAECILEQDLTKSERSQKFLEYTAELSSTFGCDWVVRATMVEESIVPCDEDVEQANFNF